jgi:hypothetical protein
MEAQPPMDDDGAVSDPKPTGRGNARLAQTVWDLVRSMALVLVVVAVLVWLSRSPETETVRAVDTAPLLAAAVATAPFDVEMPGSSTGLIPTSVRLAPTEASRPDVVWHVGWVTPDTQYVQLSQSQAASSSYIEEQTAKGRPGDTIALAGRSWQRYETSQRRSLVSTAGGVTTIVSGTLGWKPLESFAGSLTQQPAARA